MEDLENQKEFKDDNLNEDNKKEGEKEMAKRRRKKSPFMTNDYKKLKKAINTCKGEISGAGIQRCFRREGFKIEKIKLPEIKSVNLKQVESKELKEMKKILRRFRL